MGITVFGSYHTDAGITRHAMMGYVDVPTFGGYVDWRAGDRWGVKVGAKGYRPSGGNRWEAQPIVMPYFRFNGKDEIGLDIGGIMYNLLRSNIGGGWGAVDTAARTLMSSASGGYDLHPALLAVEVEPPSAFTPYKV